MPTVHCFDCGDLVRDADIACTGCARPADRRPLTPIHPSNASLRPTIALEAQLCIVFGGLAVMLAPLLPWSLGAYSPASGLEVLGPAALLLSGLGLLSVIGSIATLRGQRDRGRVVAAATVFVAGGVSLLYCTDFRDSVRQLGPGIWACAAGCVLLALGVTATLRRRR